MSKGVKIFSRRIALLGVIGVPLLFAVACSSDPRTCAEGNRSEACRVGSSDRDMPTGSIRQPDISKPATVRSSAQTLPPYVVHRQVWRPQPVQVARYRQPVTCDVTGSIPPSAANNGYRTLPPAIAADRLSHPFVHIVRRGETLYMIARRYNVPLLRIARYNEIDYGAPLRSGTSLFIPLS